MTVWRTSESLMCFTTWFYTCILTTYTPIQSRWRSWSATLVTGTKFLFFVVTVQLFWHYIILHDNVILVHSVLTEKVGFHVNGCLATLRTRKDNQVLDDNCWKTSLHGNGPNTDHTGGGRILLSLHQMMAIDPFKQAHAQVPGQALQTFVNESSSSSPGSGSNPQSLSRVPHQSDSGTVMDDH